MPRPRPRPDAARIPEGFVPRITSVEQLEQALERLPDAPGVYIMRGRRGEPLYVGKAVRARARVRQYFAGQDPREFVPRLRRLVGDIEVVVTSNASEALLLENNLIKTLQPRFNVKLRDDASYLVARLDPRVSWPRIELVRQVRDDGAHYFGPYSSAASARETLRVVNRHFQLRTCTDYVLNHRTRACLQHHIGRCPAPCVLDVDAVEYATQVRRVTAFLDGRHRELVEELRARMLEAAGAMEFERAARLRDQISALERALQTQVVVGDADANHDVVGLYREGGAAEVAVLHVREGNLIGSEQHSLRDCELSDPLLIAQFLFAYYERLPSLPAQVWLPCELEDDDAVPLAQWLRERRGRGVKLRAPLRGDKQRMIELANKNAAAAFATRRDRAQDQAALLERVRDQLGLEKLPRVIECFDVSHTQGQEAIASMVVFVDGQPDRARYRLFRIKQRAQGDRHNDDFAAMYEVLSRRVRRAQQTDEGWDLPDLWVIDGGRGQLSRVLAALEDAGVPTGGAGIEVVALAKARSEGFIESRQRAARRRARAGAADARDAALEQPGFGAALERAEVAAVHAEDDDGRAHQTGVATKSLAASNADEADAHGAWHDADTDAGDSGAQELPERVFVHHRREPLPLRKGTSERHLFERIRDEAHRFAITAHRRRRGKVMLRSALDDIQGVGPSLKKALLQRFGSVQAIAAAEPLELLQVRGVGPALVARIKEQLS